eukprot:TRINITY_DN7798_c3_g1_i1.p1 TRINITY_DN7798_c3_g1~~TRINITY_DN7798_c3_g1_i1.p1  ORF type:complete len:203 (-),score=52.34 TRINITY_DN7798_c3_g1_i1:21-629(-)
MAQGWGAPALRPPVFLDEYEPLLPTLLAVPAKVPSWEAPPTLPAVPLPAPSKPAVEATPRRSAQESRSTSARSSCSDEEVDAWFAAHGAYQHLLKARPQRKPESASTSARSSRNDEVLGVIIEEAPTLPVLTPRTMAPPTLPPTVQEDFIEIWRAEHRASERITKGRALRQAQLQPPTPAAKAEDEGLFATLGYWLCLGTGH